MRYEPIPYLIERLKARWTSERVTSRPGASLEDLAAFEVRYRVKMPADLRAYFAAIDGMSEDDWDNKYYCQFFCLGKFVPIAEYEESLAQHEWASRYFLLLDHSIGVFYYAICLSADLEEGCPVIVWDGPNRWAFAASFSEFLDRYLAVPETFFNSGARIED